MAIITAANFDYKGPLANFERDSYATLSAMVSVNENYLPNLFIGVCLETGKAYLFNKSNTVDSVLGKWREIAGSEDAIRKTDDFSTFEPLFEGEIVQYVGATNQNYTHGYFYKQHKHVSYTNIQFTPKGDYEIEVSISDEDLTHFLNDVIMYCEEPYVQGEFNYRQTNPEVQWSFSPETASHTFRSYLNTPEGYTELGFTVTPPIGEQQGLTFTVEPVITYTWEQIDVQPSTPLIWGNITGTLSDQTDLNTELTGLQNQIDVLKSRGRYLSTWNANTGLPTTNPTELPYELKAGDYYIVGQLADEEHLEIEQAVGSSLSDLSVDFDTFVTAVDPDEDVDTEYTFLYSVDTWSLDGADIDDISEYGITFEGTPVDTDEIKVTYVCAKTNKRPDVVWENNKPYYTGTASTVVETAELSLNDSYIFDGTQWALLANADSKVNDVRLNGVSVVTDKIANLDLVAADSSYHNDAVGTITNVQQALDTLMNIHYYQAPKGTFTVSNLGETTREIGTVIEQPFTLSWNLTNRTLEAVDVCYYKLPGDSTQYTVSAVPGSYIYTTDVTSNTRNDSKTFSFYYKDNHTTKPSTSSTDTYTGSATVTFKAKMYYGVSTKSSLTDAEIRALSSEWCTNQDSITTSKQGSTIVQYRNFGPFTDANNDFYVYLVFPTADCINGHGIKFTEGFETNDYQLTQRNVESATGLTNVQYNIYRFHANNAYPSGSTTTIKIEKM